MSSTYVWRIIIRKECKIKVGKQFILFILKTQKHQLLRTEGLDFLLKQMIDMKLTLKISESLNPLLKMLVLLDCVEFELIDFRKRKLLAINFYPKITKKSPAKWELAKHCYFQKNKETFELKASYSDRKINFYSMEIFDKSKKINADLKLIVFNILSSINFIKKPNDNDRWDFHDDLFHQMTRSDNLYLSSNKASSVSNKKTQTVVLPKIKSLIGSRKSRRAHNSKPISFKKISTLLKSIGEKKPKQHLFFGNHYQGVYPSAGGTYENEFYLLVGNCQKLEMDLYKYDGFEHTLKSLEIGIDNTIGMLKMAAFRINQKNVLPHAVVIVTSKIPLLQKKYSKVAYRLSLLNTGVITAYLDVLANQLELAGCPTGSTDWKVFEQVTGIDHLEETAMMEYVIGESDYFKGYKSDEKAKY